MIITTPYTAHGIRIERGEWIETSMADTGAPVNKRSIMISAGRDAIVEVAEVLVHIEGSARRHLVHEAILGGEWVVDRVIDMPKSTITTTLPPPYGSLPTGTTGAGPIEDSEATITVRDTTEVSGITAVSCKRISILSGLDPTCQLFLDLPMAKCMASTQPHDYLMPRCYVLGPEGPPIVRVMGGWNLVQRYWIPPPPTIPRLYNTPSIFHRISTMIKTLVEAGTSKNPVQHLPAAQTPKQ